MDSLEAAVRITEGLIAKIQMSELSSYVNAAYSNPELLGRRMAEVGEGYGYLFRAVYAAVMNGPLEGNGE